jgi:hypothetical protein
MSGVQKLYGFLALILLSTLNAFADPSLSQVNQFAKDGLSFSYSSDWTLEDQSDAQMQSFSLTRGTNEAQIIVAALRKQMTMEQLLKIQPIVTEALAETLMQAMEQSGAQVQRSSLSATIGGTQAYGIRLRAVGRGEAGTAEIYWLVLGDRLIHIVYVGSDQERARATDVWNMLCSTLRGG